MDVREQLAVTIDSGEIELTDIQKRAAELYLTKHAHGMDNRSIMSEVGHKTPRVLYKWLEEAAFQEYMEQMIESDPEQYKLLGKYRRTSYEKMHREAAEQELLRFVKAHPNASFQQMADALGYDHKGTVFRMYKRIEKKLGKTLR